MAEKKEKNTEKIGKKRWEIGTSWGSPIISRMLLKEETANELGAKLIASCGIFEVDRHDLEQMVKSMNSSCFFGILCFEKKKHQKNDDFIGVRLGRVPVWEDLMTCDFFDVCSQIFLEVKFGHWSFVP